MRKASNALVMVEGDFDGALRQFMRESKKATRTFRQGGKRRDGGRHFNFIPKSKRNRKKRERAEYQAARNGEHLDPLVEAIVSEHNARETRQEKRLRRRRVKPILLDRDHDLGLAASQAGGAIIEFATSPPRYPVLWDNDKIHPRFPFGGKNKPGDTEIDTDIFATISREVAEEIFYQLDTKLKFSPEDVICSMSLPDTSGSGSHYKTFCFARVPGTTKINPAGGVEQKRVELWTAQQIMQAIVDGQFQEDHGTAFLNAIDQKIVTI